MLTKLKIVINYKFLILIQKIIIIIIIITIIKYNCVTIRGWDKQDFLRKKDG